MKLTDKITNFMLVNHIKTLADFARQVDLPYSTVDSIFKKSSNITASTLLKLKNLMVISADELLDDNIDVNFEQLKNKKYINGDVDVPDNTVISIGRGGKRSIYTIADSDALIVDNLLERLGKKNE